MRFILYIEIQVTILRSIRDSPTPLRPFPAPLYFHLRAAEAGGRSPASPQGARATPPHSAARANLHLLATRSTDQFHGHRRSCPRLQPHGAAPSSSYPSTRRLRHPQPAHHQFFSARAPRPHATCDRSTP